MARSAVSISDVASLAGVSRATVSRVLSGRESEQIASSTRSRVEEAVERLGYHPNAMARGLSRMRTNSIGLVFLHTHQPIHTSESFAMMLDGILSQTTYHQKDALVCTSYSWADGRKHMSPLLDRRCEGLILVVPRIDAEAVPVLAEYEVPFVLLCGQSDDPRVSTVDTDNVSAARDLVDHLIEMEHRRIAFVGLGPDTESFSYARGRLEGYRLAHAGRGFEPDPRLIIRLNDPDSEIRSLMTLPTEQRPTAIFGVTDHVAFKIISILQRNSLRVPEDISVVGYDGVASAMTMDPVLTTIRQPLKQLGERSVELLLDLIDQKVEPGRKEFLPTELVAGGTARAPQDFQSKQPE